MRTGRQSPKVALRQYISSTPDYKNMAKEVVTATFHRQGCLYIVRHPHELTS